LSDSLIPAIQMIPALAMNNASSTGELNDPMA
jgi:hypothetical protein